MRSVRPAPFDQRARFPAATAARLLACRPNYRERALCRLSAIRAGELSLLLGELQVAMADEASVMEVAHLRQRAETGRRPAMVSVAVRALEVADCGCWNSLTRGDATAFLRQAAVCAELWEFGVCAGLLEER